MKWIKRGLIGLILLIIIVPALIYVFTTDWSRQHSAYVDQLPVYNNSMDQGIYRLTTNNLEFLIRVKGMKNTGDPIILLHGFPETSIMWQPLMDSLAERGHRVLAFDQRGYSPGARPSGTAYYHIDSLTSDVLSVANQVGFDIFHLVGHDWGSAVGWKTVMDYPNRIHTWTAMSIPHIGVFFPATTEHPQQKEKSGYMNLLRKPILPELFYHAFQNKIYDGLKNRWTAEQINEYKSVFGEPGAFKAALNWYRAMDMNDDRLKNSLNKLIHRPTLYIYGSKDPVVAQEIIPLQESLIDTTCNIIKLEAGHSLIQEAESAVIHNVLDHIQ